MKEIKNCFQGVEIFITGGSGVVGRALIEKLLRSCDISRIYILIRPKKGVSAKERLTTIRNHKIFRELNLIKPDELQKLVAVSGDIEMENLGISAEETHMLQNVSFVYHCAATVRFDEPLQRAINMNIGGTLHALSFAEKLKKLRLFMHVSTYFSNPYLEYVEPKVYTPPMDWRLCLKLATKDDDDDSLKFLTKKIITGFPNTYCFTKSISESLVNDYCDRLPIAIFRPSIVIFSMDEPVPGFPPSVMGAMGLFLGVATGVVKGVYMNPLMLDIMPQDCMANALAYYTMHADNLYKTGKQSTAPVYIISTTKYFKHTLADIYNMGNDVNAWTYWGYEKALLLPSCCFTNNRLLYNTIVFTKQLVPALLGDLLLRFFGQKPVMMSIQRKIYVMQNEMKAFMFNRFYSDGFSLEQQIFKDTERTSFDVARLKQDLELNKNICVHLLNMTYEMREHLLDENPATIPKYRRIVRIKQFTYTAIRFIAVFYALNWLINFKFADKFEVFDEINFKNSTFMIEWPLKYDFIEELRK